MMNDMVFSVGCFRQYPVSRQTLCTQYTQRSCRREMEIYKDPNIFIQISNQKDATEFAINICLTQREEYV